jgi:hypothetical protein
MWLTLFVNEFNNVAGIGKGKNTKLVPVVYLIYNLLLVVSKQTQKSL